MEQEGRLLIVEPPQELRLVASALAVVSARRQLAVMISAAEEVRQRQVLLPVPVDTCCVEQLVVLERGQQVVADTA